MVNQKVEIETIAKVLIVDAQNRGLVLTLGKHLKYPEKSYSPDLPGGVVGADESEQAAVIREVHEECGITLDPQSVRLVCSSLIPKSGNITCERQPDGSLRSKTILAGTPCFKTTVFGV